MEDELNMDTVSIHQLRHLVQVYEKIIQSMEDDEYESQPPELINHLADIETHSWNNAHVAWENEYAS